MNWQPVDLEILRDLAAAGMAASRIAKEFTAAVGETVTRNMIIGKCHRNGIHLKGSANNSDETKGRLSQAMRARWKDPLQRLQIIASQRRAWTPEKRAEQSARVKAAHARRAFIRAAEREASMPPKPTCEPVTFLDLEQHHCRFAVTDRPPHLFCGSPKAGGQSWCAYHCRIVYQGDATARAAA